MLIVVILANYEKKKEFYISASIEDQIENSIRTNNFMSHY